LVGDRRTDEVVTAIAIDIADSESTADLGRRERRYDVQEQRRLRRKSGDESMDGFAREKRQAHLGVLAELGQKKVGVAVAVDIARLIHNRGMGPCRERERHGGLIREARQDVTGASRYEIRHLG